MSLLWWLRVVVVTGPSMEPTLRDNDRVLVRRKRRIRREDIVLVAMPSPKGEKPRWIVKRVAALAGDPGLDGSPVPTGMLMLLGDNAEASADSRDFGYVPAGWVFGVVTRKLGYLSLPPPVCGIRPSGKHAPPLAR